MADRIPLFRLGGTVSNEQIDARVENYLEENPPMAEASEEGIDAGIVRYFEDNPIPSGGFVFRQTTPSSNWSFTHLLGREPNVSVFINGELVLAEVHVTDTTVAIPFPSPKVGVVVLT